MPDTKITGLAALTGAQLAAADLLVAVDVSDTSMAASGTDKYIRADELTKALWPPGIQLPYAGRTAPSGFLMEYGQAVSRSTYAALFAIMVPLLGTCTISNAAPGVTTLNAHGLVEGDAFFYTTTGTLPTGLSPNVLYYAKNVSPNTFEAAATRTDTAAGTGITTSSAGSGTHSVYACPYGLGDGSTTFNVPDKRGRGSVGPDAMGGSADAGVLTKLNAIGLVHGSQTHQLTTAELATHGHAASGSDAGHGHTGWVSGDGSGSCGANSVRRGASVPFSFVDTGVATGYASISVSVSNAGGDTAHNNMQPMQQDNWIIKT